jgi:hypothetical protein
MTRLDIAVGDHWELANRQNRCQAIITEIHDTGVFPIRGRMLLQNEPEVVTGDSLSWTMAGRYLHEGSPHWLDLLGVCRYGPRHIPTDRFVSTTGIVTPQAWQF